MKPALTYLAVISLAAALAVPVADAQTSPPQATTSPPTTTPSSPDESVTVTGHGVHEPQNQASTSTVDGFFGGLTGEDLVRSIDALDRPMAYKIFVSGLSGELGQWTDWHGLRGDGRIRPTRAFMDGATACRDFTAQVALNQPEERTVMGTACREADGWRFR